MACLSDEQIHDYLSNKLSQEESAQVEEHVEECAACEDRLRRLSDPPEEDVAGPADAPTEDLPARTSHDQSRRIGAYKLLQKIGEGGMGEVWMAEQERPVRRRVALKLIRPGMDSKEVIARFEAERQALAMMDHQNIAKVLDAGQTADGRPYFAMELVQGIPFNQYCDRNKLPLIERLELFVPICRSVQHAHQKGIIHRDLKPTNVLVTLYDGQPVPKVIDFGLAKALQHQTRLTDRTLFTEFNQVVGTVQYMSPEQAEMNALNVDTRTDIYSLGVMLYELLTGTTPIELESVGRQAIFEILRSIMEVDPPRPSTRLSASGKAVEGISAQRRIESSKLQQILRGDLDWITMKALEKDRTRRYATADALAEDIERFLHHEPVEARPPSVAYRMRKSFRRNRAVALTLLVVFVSLLVGIAGTVWQAMRANAAAIQARIAEAKASSEAERARGAEREARSHAADERAARQRVEEQEQLAEQRLEESRRAWHQAFLAQVAGIVDERPLEALQLLDNDNIFPRNLRGFVWGHYRNLAQRVASKLEGHREYVWTVAFSPDGVLLATGAGGADSTVKIWEASTGNLVTTITDHQGGVWEAAFSPDGKLLATCSNDGTIKLWSTADWKLIQSVDANRGLVGRRGVMSVTFSPDGTRLASGGIDLSIRVWQVSTDPVELRLLKSFDSAHRNVIRRVRFSGDSKRIASCADDRRLVIWDMESGEELFAEEISGQTAALEFIPASDLLALASGSVIQIRDLQTGGVVDTLRDHNNWVYSLAASPDGRWLASASWDKKVKLWNLEGARELMATFDGHAAQAVSVCFSPDGELLASGSGDHTAILWNTTVKRSHQLAGTAVLSSSGNSFATLDEHHVARLWSAKELGELSSQLLDRRLSNPLVYSDDGKLVAAVSGTTLVHRIDAASGEPAGDSSSLAVNSSPLPASVRMVGLPIPFYGAAVSPDVQLLACESRPAHVELWNIESSHREFRLAAKRTSTASYPVDALTALAFSPTGDRLVSVYGLRDLIVWNTATGEEIEVAFDNAIDGQTLYSAVAFARDGGELIAGDMDGRIHSWTLDESGVYNRAFAPQTTQATNSIESLIRRAFAGGRARSQSIRSPILRIQAAADGMSAVVVGEGGELRVWDVESRNLLGFAASHPGCVTAARTSDGERVVSADLWGEIRFWRVGRSKDMRAQHLDASPPIMRLEFDPGGGTLIAERTSRVESFAIQEESIQSMHSTLGRLVSAGKTADGDLALVIWNERTLVLSADNGQPQWQLEALDESILSSGISWVPIAFSPDHTKLAVQTSGGLRLYNAADGTEVARFAGVSVVPISVAFSANWEYLALSDSENPDEIIVWDVNDQMQIGRLNRFSGRPWTLAFSDDSEWLVVGAAHDRSVRVWNVTTRTELVKPLNHLGAAYAVRFLRGGQTLVSTGVEGDLKLWNVDDWTERLTTFVYREEQGPPLELNLTAGHPVEGPLFFSSDGELLVVRSDYASMYIWDVDSGKLLGMFNRDGKKVLSATLSPNKELLLLLHDDASASVWSTRTGKLISQLDTGSVTLANATFSPDSRSLATSNSAGNVTVWDPITGRQWIEFRTQQSVESLAFLADGLALVAGLGNHKSLVWRSSPDDGTRSSAEGGGRPGGRVVVAISSDGALIAMGDGAGRIEVVHRSTGRRLYKMDAHASPVRQIAFSPAGAILASAGDDEACKLWDLETGHLLFPLENIGGRVTALDFSPDGTRLAVGSYLNASVWNLATRQQEFRFPHESQVLACDFSPDGRQLATASSAGRSVRIWRLLGRGALEGELAGLAVGGLQVRYSSGGERIIGAGSEGEVCVWDVKQATQLRNFNPQIGWPRSVALTDNGDRAVACGEEGTVVQWNVVSGREILRHKSRADGISSADVCPSADLLAVAASYGPVRVLQLSNRDENTILRELTTIDSAHLAASSEDARQHVVAIDAELEEAALRRVAKLFDELLLKDEVLERLRNDPDSPLRTRALVWANRRQDVGPATLNEWAWPTVLSQSELPAEYQRALRMAEKAVAASASQSNGVVLRTLGVAQYRCGQFAEAVETLHHSLRANALRASAIRASSEQLPHDLAFLAMAFARLGDHEQSSAYFERAKQTAAEPRWSDDEEVKRIMREAVQIIDKTHETTPVQPSESEIGGPRRQWLSGEAIF